MESNLDNSSKNTEDEDNYKWRSRRQTVRKLSLRIGYGVWRKGWNKNTQRSAWKKQKTIKNQFSVFFFSLSSLFATATCPGKGNFSMVGMNSPFPG